MNGRIKMLDTIITVTIVAKSVQPLGSRSLLVISRVQMKRSVVIGIADWISSLVHQGLLAAFWTFMVVTAIAWFIFCRVSGMRFACEASCVLEEFSTYDGEFSMDCHFFFCT